MFDLEKLLLHDAKNHIHAINILLRRNYTYDFNMLDFEMVCEILADVENCGEFKNPSILKSVSGLREIHANFNLNEKKEISPCKLLAEVLIDFNYQSIENSHSSSALSTNVLINPIILKQFYKILIYNSLEAKTREKDDFKITLESKISFDKYNFTITDNGIGMCETIKSKILSGEKVPESSKKRGWGVGIYLIQNYFKQNPGSFELVYSEPNEGTSFKLSLPIAKETSTMLH